VTTIAVRRGESVEKALRRLKKVLIREDLFGQLRKRRHYEKPSTKERAKVKAARFNAMLKQRYADL
jgi:small subunit ribosomal protein S21